MFVCMGASVPDMQCQVLRYNKRFNNVQVCKMTKIMEEELFSLQLGHSYPVVRVAGYCNEADSA